MAGMAVLNDIWVLQLSTPGNPGLSANPETIIPGSSSTLNWSVEGFTSATIDNGIGVLTPTSAGSVEVTPSATTTYILSAYSNIGNGSASATVTVSDDGHIGAFYFGPIEANINLTDNQIMTYSADMLQPTVVASSAISVSVTTPKPMEVVYRMLQPSVRATADLDISFVGIPRIGISPLTVDFEATITFNGGYQDKYYVTEYQWYFDYENYPSVYETSTSPTITHIYNGYAGQTYDVRLCVEIGTK